MEKGQEKPNDDFDLARNIFFLSHKFFLEDSNAQEDIAVREPQWLLNESTADVLWKGMRLGLGKNPESKIRSGE